MQGVVMAGGQGTRLRPLTLSDPKPFLPVAGRPVIEWGLLALKRAGIEDVVITTAYKKSVLQAHLGDGEALGLNIQYAEETTPLGTAGGVKNAEELLHDRFVVMSADVVSDVDLGNLIAFHENANALATIGLTRVKEVSQFGIVVTDDKGAVTRFQEKPKPEEAFSDLVNAGIYVCERSVLDNVPKDTPFDFSKDLWPTLIGKRLYGAPVEGYWKDVGRPDDLIEANREQCKRIGQWRFGHVDVAGDAVVEDSVLMDGCQVASGARIVRSVVLPRTEVGVGAEVTDSVLASDVKVGAGAVLKRAVLGANETVPGRERLVDVRVPAPAE